MHKHIETKDAPQAIGPYSQAIVVEGGKHIYISGQIPLNPATMKVESTDVRQQTRTVLKNIDAILHAAGGGPNNVVKACVYLKNMDDFARINEEYSKYFCEHKPARACVEVARLPRDVLIEIDAIAVI